jgi:hypothetical protein
MVGFDRAGYGESDPNPIRSPRSAAQDMEELANALGLGDKFYVVGFSLPGLPRRVGRAQVHPAPDRRRGDAGAGGELLVARVPRGPGGGGVRPAAARRPVGVARVAPRAGGPALVDGADLAARLHRRRQHHPPPQQARRRGPTHAPEEEGDGHAAGHPRVVLPGRDGHVRQVGVRPHEPAGAAVPGAPVAGRRGRTHARRVAAAHRQEAQLGELPRASRHLPLPVRRPRARGHRSPDAFRLTLSRHKQF